MDPHYFHPQLDNDALCAKCDGGPHGLVDDSPPPTEQDTLLAVFGEMLKAVTADGGRKRAAGLKKPWWRDLSHEAAIFSHLNAWKHGVKQDHESGAHPLTHLAWRCLAIAYQETHGQVNPEPRR